MLLRTVLGATIIASTAAAAAASRAVYFEGGDNVRRSKGLGAGADWQLADDSFCAHELARYIFLTTGDYPALVDTMEEPAALEQALADSQHDAILLVSPGSRLLDLAVKLSGAEHVRVVADSMDPSPEIGHHTIHRLDGLKTAPDSTLTMIVGAGEFGRLYGVYSAAEQLGVRFQLTGDILPDPTSAGGLPLAGVARLPLIERDYASPMFDFRGLQPFHDFPEGPDWWDTQHYKLIVSQLSKMKMNFIGLHTYPYDAANAGHSTGHNEPTVFVGTLDDLETDGSVKTAAAYPTSYANTMRGEWGYAPMATSNYSWGTAALFESDCWAPEPTTTDVCPYPTTQEGSAAFFERTSTMLADAFAHAKAVGVQSCVGTETPLSKPSVPGPKCSVKGLPKCYKDTPSRILPHVVTINSNLNTHEWCAGQCALANFTIAAVEYGAACLCGTTFPDLPTLPTSECASMACAGNSTEKCGGNYILSAFEFECDESKPHKAAPTTQDYYEGMFTRLKKKVPALDWYWIWTPEAWEWGHMSSQNKVFTDAVEDLKDAMAAHDKINPELKMATNGWVVGPLPDRSIFDQELPTTWDAITSIDLNTGHSPVDPSYLNVTRHKKWAIPWMEDDPDLSAPQLWVNRTLEHMEDAKKYGCNGLLGIHWRTHAVGPQISAMGAKSWDPTLNSKSFWLDWSKASFGESAAIPEIAAVFESIDSFLMPLVVSWAGGPGKMHPTCDATAKEKFAFVSKLEEAGQKVTGTANLARFSYWLSTFHYMKAISDTNCAWADYNAAMDSVKKDKSRAKSVGLAARHALVANATTMITHLQQTLTNVGELGTYMNIESHSLLEALDSSALEAALGESLPPSANPPKVYQGKTGRLIVPTARTTLEKAEPLPLRAVVLAAEACTEVTITYQPMPSAATEAIAAGTVSMKKVAREVYEGSIPAQSQDFEYYVTAKCGGESLVFPTGAPAIQQSVVLI